MHEKHVKILNHMELTKSQFNIKLGASFIAA